MSLFRGGCERIYSKRLVVSVRLHRLQGGSGQEFLLVFFKLNGVYVCGCVHVCACTCTCVRACVYGQPQRQRYHCQLPTRHRAAAGKRSQLTCTDTHTQTHLHRHVWVFACCISRSTHTQTHTHATSPFSLVCVVYVLLCLSPCYLLGFLQRLAPQGMGREDKHGLMWSKFSAIGEWAKERAVLEKK